MEQLNRIELRGNIGSIRLQKISGVNVANFTLATNLAYKDKDGDAVIETTWHNVSAWEGKEITCLENLGRGDKVHLVGRIRNQRYVDSNGNDRCSTEVVALRITKIDDNEVLTYQM